MSVGGRQSWKRFAHQVAHGPSGLSCERRVASSARYSALFIATPSRMGAGGATALGAASSVWRAGTTIGAGANRGELVLRHT